jgi:hypothetical protein
MECEVVVKGGWSQIAAFFLMTSLAALFQFGEEPDHGW